MRTVQTVLNHNFDLYGGNSTSDETIEIYHYHSHERVTSKLSLNDSLNSDIFPRSKWFQVFSFQVYLSVRLFAILKYVQHKLKKQFPVLERGYKCTISIDENRSFGKCREVIFADHYLKAQNLNNSLS